MKLMKHPQRRNVTTAMAGLKNGHIRKNLTHGEPQRKSWGTQKKKVNPKERAVERRRR